MVETRTRLPRRIATLLESWTEVYLSPKSNSYYNVPHHLIMTVGACRISNHWNLNDTYKTDIPVREGDWTVATYNGATWVVSLSLNPSKNARTVNIASLNIKQ